MYDLKPPSAARTGVTLSFGMVAFPVDLVPALMSEESLAKAAGATAVKTKLVCGTCEAPELVSQRYVCDHDHLQEPGETRKAFLVDEVLTRFAEPEELATAKATTASGEEADTSAADLQFFPSADVEAATFTTGLVYRLRPHGKSKKAKAAAAKPYAAVVHLAANPQTAILLELSVKSGTPHLFRLVTHDGLLTLVELSRPERKAVAPDVELPELDERVIAQAQSFVEFARGTFDPAEWADGRQAQLRKLAGASAPVTELPTATPSADDDLLAALTASLNRAA